MRTPWTNAGMAKDLSWLTDKGPFSLDRLAAMTAIAGSPGAITYVAQHYHALVGRHYQIEAALSRDLLASDFSGSAKFTDVPWPAPSAELYFEDPLIPTALVQFQDAPKLERVFPGLQFAAPAFERQEPRLVVIMESGIRERRQACCLNLRPGHWDRVMRGERIRMADLGLLPTLPLSEAEDGALVAMALMALKIFAFISVYPEESLARSAMHYGGKPGVRGRPQRPSARVRYVHSVGRAHGRPKTTGLTRKFLGRRGHFRHFRHERYIHMGGKWTYISPLPAPDGTVPPVPEVRVTRRVGVYTEAERASI